MVKKIPQTSVDEKRKSVISKLIFVSLMGALVGLMYIVGNIRVGKEKSDSASRKAGRAFTEKGSVIGEETSVETEQLKSALSKQIDQFRNTASNYQDEIQTTAGKAIQEGKKEIESKATDVIYQTTIKPLIDKVQSLPETQQEYIKEELCR